ncbi:MAG: peptide deformylase [Acidimicrobiia bacterium]|nr:peptide deformylase [Acidimicrobiia bacterium]
MIRPIPQIGDPVLRQEAMPIPSEEIASGEVQSLIDDLIETMRDADGAGIAANQVGVPRRVCVIGVDDNPRYPYKPHIPLTVLVNPMVTVLGDESFASNEGCLSVPVRGDLRRWAHVEVSALDRGGEPFVARFRGLSAGTVQHEVDHLDGRLIVDHVEDSRSLSTWENFDRFHKEAFLAHIASVVERYHG